MTIKPYRVSVRTSTKPEASRVLAPHFILPFAVRPLARELRHA
ncbi:hypothetical protein [Photorhabdus antumapuensis]|nr:hypothetical protein [Photorhabdus antumapuensis]